MWVFVWNQGGRWTEKVWEPLIYAIPVSAVLNSLTLLHAFGLPTPCKCLQVSNRPE
jgi:hypothetical protein